MPKTKLKTINEIDFKTINIGDKLNFLYQSSSKKWGGKKEDVMIPVILKDDYFNDFIESLKKNKVKKNKEIRTAKKELKFVYRDLEEIKGSYTKENKEARYHLKKAIDIFYEGNDLFKSENEDKYPLMFFKNFSVDKVINKKEAYEVEVIYGGKRFDKRNGKEGHLFITNKGEIDIMRVDELKKAGIIEEVK